MTQQAIIYCRVSDPKQANKGHGLESQEIRCREYARHKGYRVAEIFHERGFTGGLIDRPAMRAMLNFLKQEKETSEYVVIIDDISRLARDLEAHIALRNQIQDAGGRLESPSIEFGEDSDSRLIERLLASVAAHQREKNAEQVKNRMRSRMQDGFWVLQAPRGYKYGKTDRYRKVMIPDPVIATIVTEALEGYACDRFDTLTDVRLFLESRSEFPKGSNGRVHPQRIKDMLNQILYTGHLYYPAWDIGLIEARHEALISMACYHRIQDKLNHRAYNPARKDIKEDFLLRGFVLCAECQYPLTSCWSKGRNKRYAYYLCHNSGCSFYKKSIRREELEDAFEHILRDLQPTSAILTLTRSVFRDYWEYSRQHHTKQQELLSIDLMDIDKKIEKILDHVVTVDNPTLISHFETHIAKLEIKKAHIIEKLECVPNESEAFESNFRTIFEILGNPHGIWVSGDIEEKLLIPKLAFSAPLSYHKDEGFRTADISLPFSFMESLSQGDSDMVNPTGKYSNRLIECLRNWKRIIQTEIPTSRPISHT